MQFKFLLQMCGHFESNRHLKVAIHINFALINKIKTIVQHILFCTTTNTKYAGWTNIAEKINCFLVNERFNMQDFFL